MKKNNFKECAVTIINETQLSNNKVYTFCEEYLGYYLAQEGKFTPSIVKNKRL